MIKVKQLLTIIALATLPSASFADTAPIDDFFAVSAYLGGRYYSDDFEDKNTGKTAEVDNSFAQALALSWYYGRNTEGEFFYSNSKQSITIQDENISTDVYISYLHFGGRVNFVNDTPFSTSIGLGLGATFFIPDESQYDNDIALSGSITGGVRYEMSDKWALKADLRVYGTVMQNNSSLFCDGGQCLITLSGEIYVQSELMAGIEYKF